MSAELPAGWRIEMQSDFIGCEIEFFYAVQQWQTWVPRKKWWWSEQPAEISGWRTVASFRQEYIAERFVTDTVRAMEATV